MTAAEGVICFGGRAFVWALEADRIHVDGEPWALAVQPWPAIGGWCATLAIGDPTTITADDPEDLARRVIAAVTLAEPERLEFDARASSGRGWCR